MSAGWMRTTFKASRGLFLFLASLVCCASMGAVPPYLTENLSKADALSGSAISDWKFNSRTVLLFLSPLCPCSRYHEPAISELAKKFPDVRFIGIYSGLDALSEEKARAHFSAASLGFSILRDKDLAIANALGAHRTPHAFVFDEQGKLIYRGAVDDKRSSQPTEKYLEMALAALKDGKPLPHTETRPMGCRIER